MSGGNGCVATNSPVNTANPSRAPVWAATGAVATTVAAVIPVFLVGGLAVQIGNELRFSPAGLGMAVAGYFTVSALCSIPAGWLVERFGDRVTSRTGILISSASMLAMALLAHSYLSLVIILVLSATANALGQLSSNLSLARQVPKHRQGLSFGVKQSAIPIATLLVGAMVPTVALTVGWRWAFVITALVVLLVLPMAPKGTDPADRKRNGANGQSERATGPLIVVALAATLAAGSANALGIFLVDSSVAQGLGAAEAGLVLTGGGIIGALSRLGGGWLADRREGKHLTVVAITLILGSVGLALLALPGMWPLLLGTALGYGLGWSWPGVLNFAVVRLNPGSPASATSITQAGVYVGAALGPLAFGLLADTYSYPMAWLISAGVMVIAAAMTLLGRRLLLAHPSVQATLSTAH